MTKNSIFHTYSIILKVRKSRNYFLSRRFLQKMNKWILLYYYETSGWLVFVRILEEIEDTKKTFWNYLTFKAYYSRKRNWWPQKTISKLTDLYCLLTHNGLKVFLKLHLIFFIPLQFTRIVSFLTKGYAGQIQTVALS